jgi:class 3 adenylate cyclase
MTQVVDDSLAAGREAARRRAWREAYDLLRGADTDGRLTPADLEQLAEAAWWTGHLEEAMTVRERAYTANAEAGDDVAAGLVALKLSMDNLTRGKLTVAQGWLGRAERLLGSGDELPHGYLALTRALHAREVAGDLDAALTQLERAQDLARRFGDRSLASLALVFNGAVLVRKGKVNEGLAQLDEATAAAVSGELEPLAAGIVYCVMIGSCQELGDCGRAAEWTDEANRWCDRLDVTGFPGACRIHRAEILRLRGKWPQAEEQARQACDELQDYNRWITASGFYEIGEIRRRRGEFAAAEEAYRRADDFGQVPQPGLALLRLAQGKVDAAASAITRALADSPQDPLGRARLLPAEVQISLEAGELDRARAAAQELEQVADEFRVGGRRTAAREGAVQLAWGQVRLAERDWQGAATALRGARETWQKVGAPYETAQARLLLGLAYRGEGDEDGARDELLAAKATFEELGAVLDLHRASELLGEAATRKTFVFTDIVDSTKLLDALGENKWRKLLAWHDRTLRALIEDAGGEVIKHTGDGYFAAFESAGAAVDAGARIQRALDEHEGIAPDVRIGVHTGGAFHKGDDDYAGQGVHVAARIGALAHAGEVLVSRESLDSGSRYPLSAPRSETLKGFDEPVELVSVDWR